MRPLLLALLALAVLVGGCGDDDSGVTTLKGPVTLSVSGGIAGLSESVIVDPDGTATLTRGSRATVAEVSAGEIAVLAEDLERGDLFDEDRVFRGRGADLREYTVTYGGVSVTADETSIPEELLPVIEFLESIPR